MYYWPNRKSRKKKEGKPSTPQLADNLKTIHLFSCWFQEFIENLNACLSYKNKEQVDTGVKFHWQNYV